ncbi:MAG: radical SAM protein [Parcubacteria group bacterium]|nr:radical SAM protein [Parcubacteria group bacterium]
MDKYGIDSHKMIYHPERVADWLRAGNNWEKAKEVYPIYIEISPSGACNYRCTFCAVDYVGYKPRFLDTVKLKKTLIDMADKGVKSIMFGGEGEPLLHPNMAELTNFTKNEGIDVSFTTNGVFLTEKFVQKTIKNISWIKVSCNAGTPETHAKIHQTKAEDFETVRNNLKNAVRIKKEQNSECVIGVQMVLVPENASEARVFAEKFKETGVNYVVIKPYSQHLFSETKKYSDVQYKDYSNLKKELSDLNDENFNCVVRLETMKSWDEKDRSYETCNSVPFFWGYIMADGQVCGCSCFLGDKRFFYGNINEKTFPEIWEGEERKKCWEMMTKKFDISGCRQNCRMDKINKYLWALKNNPPNHVNFI